MSIETVIQTGSILSQVIQLQSVEKSLRIVDVCYREATRWRRRNGNGDGTVQNFYLNKSRL